MQCKNAAFIMKLISDNYLSRGGTQLKPLGKVRRVASIYFAKIQALRLCRFHTETYFDEIGQTPTTQTLVNQLI